MAESTLSGAYSDFREEIAFYLGYGRTSTSWTTAQTNTIASILKSGLRQFYYPPMVPGRNLAHDWSFMHPVTTLDIGSTSGTVDGLPVYDGSTYSTITATGSVFESRMADGNTTITFDTSEEAYTVYSYTSTTVITVIGDASGEASGDTITISAQAAYDLPDSFGAIEGGFTFDENTIYGVIKVVSEKQIRQLEQQSDSDNTGQPQYCAIRPIAPTATAGQRYEVVFYPRPDDSYTLTYQYIPLPDTLTSSYPYPWGGSPHTETVLASCLAVAEERLEDSRGEKYQYFIERLMASISWDIRANTPETLGYNGDGSLYGTTDRMRLSQSNIVTVL